MMDSTKARVGKIVLVLNSFSFSYHSIPRLNSIDSLLELSSSFESSYFLKGFLKRPWDDWDELDESVLNKTSIILCKVKQNDRK